MNSPLDAPAVWLERLVKDYASDWRGGRVRALDGVTLAVARGSVCALVGANGSGKSTALKLCAGLVRPTAGGCRVAGLTPAEAARCGRVAYLPEETLLPDFDSARGFLRRLAAIGGIDGAAAGAAVETALAQTGLAALADRPLATFSKGQRQRVGLAQALLRGPDILLLDEPASGLDPHAQAALQALIVRQRALGRTVVLTAHFLTPLEEFCDQFVLLHGGRVIFEGSRAAVTARGGLERIYRKEVPP
ncbi:ABC transporter ATP-binding protein [Oleiharenicola sp. Vm1]|uniref:ABC transporter ATP-binding protein n=1 Tax=Oleiharenicola sp. Vm1 TaxID=3398393 RepID=UPI0039F478C9